MRERQLTRLRRDPPRVRLPGVQPGADADGAGEHHAPARHRAPPGRPRLLRRGRARPSGWRTASTTSRRELSGGQQQRVACARALVSRPAVVFADEPTGNLDSTSSGEVLGFLRRSVDELGQSVVMVTHDPTAASYAHRVLFLADGRLVGELVDPTPSRVLDALGGSARAAPAACVVPLLARTAGADAMTRVALRGIRAHLVRFLLSVLAVALGVAFVAGTFALRTMLSSTFDGIVDGRGTRATPTSAGRRPTVGASPSQENVGEVRNERAARRWPSDDRGGRRRRRGARPSVAGPIVLVGADGTAVQSTQAPSFALRLRRRTTGRSTLVEGRAPAAARTRSRSSRPRSSRSGLAVGDTTDRRARRRGPPGRGRRRGRASAARWRARRSSLVDPQTAEHAATRRDGTVADHRGVRRRTA